MLKTRIIPTLLYKDFGLVKGKRFDSRRAIGSPVQAISVYERRDVDELIFLDVAATLQGRPPDYDLIDRLADDCFMPLTVGGGVTSVDDVGRLLEVGADKVCLGTAAVDSPHIVQRAADRFGSQCIVVAVDWRVAGDHGQAVAWTHSGTKPTAFTPVSLAEQLEGAGAGEIIATCIDRDGTMDGYDLTNLAAVTSAVRIPVIASGGAGTYQDFLLAVTEANATAVAAGSMFLFTEQTPREAREFLGHHGIPVRGQQS